MHVHSGSVIFANMTSDTIVRQRKQNWSDEEIVKLLDYVEVHYDQLYGKFSSNVTHQAKRRLWESTPLQNRTWEECRHKFQKLKSEKITEYNNFLKASNATGGGPAPESPTEITERIIAIVGSKNPKISGIDGGIDTSTSAICDDQPTHEENDDEEDIIETAIDEPPSKLKRASNAASTGKGKSEVRSQLEDRVHQNLEKQHELSMEKLRNEMELLQLQSKVAQLQLENEEKRKVLLSKKLERFSSDEYAFLS